MRKLSFPKINGEKVKNNFSGIFTDLADGGFKKIFRQIDQMGIKKGVDEMGIDKFVQQCALMAAGSGMITGVGGFATMLVGVPLDLINVITQQFRVTLAVTYHLTGRYEIRFDDLFKIVARSLKADTGMAVTKNVMEEVAAKMMLGVGSKTARKLIPVVGAVIGGSVNYLFIKRLAKSLLENA